MQTIGDAVEEYVDPDSVTSGNFANEDDSKRAFVEAFKATDCFNIYEEIDCWYFGGSVFGDKPTGRIDYVLAPRKRLIDAGWRMGIIGIEVKKSGHKAGPLICQMIDYSKAVFRLPDACGASMVCLSSVCCFPGITHCGYAIGSIMCQHRLGNVIVKKQRTMIQVGSTNMFSLSDRGIECRFINSGYKNGSR